MSGVVAPPGAARRVGNAAGATAPPGTRRMELTGWGRWPRATSDVFRAETLRDLRLAAHPGGMIARGLGRSYGDAALNGGGGAVLTERLNRILAFDERTGTVDCEPGVTVADLVRVFLPRGWFAPVSPGTKHVTLGGAVACDVHGKNHHRAGSLGRHVLELDLLLASGRILTCSPAENAELFRATIGGLGLTGIITRVRLALKRKASAFVSVDYDRMRDLDEALRALEERDGGYEYSVAWIDCLARGRGLGRSVLMQANDAEVDDGRAARRAAGDAVPHDRSRLRVPFDLPAWLLNPATIRAFNTCYFRAQPAKARGVVRSLEQYFYPLDAVGDWNRAYGARGFLQYQFVLPAETARRGLIDVLETVSRGGSASFLAVLKRFGAGLAESPLSFPAAGYTLALDLPRRPGVEADLLRLDQRIVHLGGRVYLAKDARLERETFRAMYPGWKSFAELKQRIDPDNVFRSDLAARLGLLA